MAVYEYADQFERQLAQKYERELVSYELTQSNPGIKFMNAQTIKIPRLTVSGYKDHNRTNMGFSRKSSPMTGILSLPLILWMWMKPIW